MSQHKPETTHHAAHKHEAAHDRKPAHKQETAPEHEGEHKATHHGHKPKFKLGDKVKLGDREGEVVEVATHDDDWRKAGGEQLYSVKCPVQEKADHTHDTLGCVKESELSHA